MRFTDSQWELLEPSLPKTPKGARGHGRQPAHSLRKILEGILWKLRSSAAWAMMPACYPPYQIFHRLLQYWRKAGTFEKILVKLTKMALEAGKLKVNEAFVDATFAPAKKKRGACVGPTKKGKGTKLMAIIEKHGYPIGLHILSASPAEIKLVEKAIEALTVPEQLVYLIDDKAYDSDPMDKQLEEKYGIQLIAPNRRNRQKKQEGRSLRKYKRRWKVERFFAWLQNWRHITVRYDYYYENYLSMIHLACSMMFLKLILR